MRAKAKKLPVIIRYEGEGSGKDWRLGDVIAIFPSEVGTNDTSTMNCYSTMDGHSSCGTGYIGSRTKPATPAMVEAMLRVLHNVGYKNLKVVKRASSHHAT